MSNDQDEVNVRGEAASSGEMLKATVEAEIAAAAERASIELGEAPPPSLWDIFALGPFQGTPPAVGPALLAQPPGRIIQKDEEATLITVVFLNTFMDTELSDFGASVQLNYFTSNIQTMQPVPAMDFSCCFDPAVNDGLVVPGIGTFYVSVRNFAPTEAACILETNICARICNCDQEVVPNRAAFVRWVASIDFDLFFPPQILYFDHPIRYLVYDNDDDTNCDCQTPCPPLLLHPQP